MVLEGFPVSLDLIVHLPFIIQSIFILLNFYYESLSAFQKRKIINIEYGKFYYVSLQTYQISHEKPMDIVLEEFSFSEGMKPTESTIRTFILIIKTGRYTRQLFE